MVDFWVVEFGFEIVSFVWLWLMFWNFQWSWKLFK